jgi:hypothetical protein
MRGILFLTAIGLLLLGIGGAGSAHSANATTNLTAGWNQVCYIGAEGPVEEALGAVAGSVQALYRMRTDGALDRWFPGRPEVSTIDTLSPQDPLLMLVAAPVEWTQSGEETADRTADMAQGWSSICYEGESRAVDEAMGGVDGELDIVYSLVPEQGWLRFVPGRSEISNLERVEPHQALLVLVSDAAGATWDFDEWEVALPPLTPLDPALEAKAHQIRDTMSSIRGLPPNPAIEEGTITQAALADYYQREAEKTRQDEGEESEAWNVAFRLLHLIGPEDDLLDIGAGLSSNILGFYSPDDDKLALVAEESASIDAADEATIAHEYTHSFQDARFDIEKLDQLAQNEKDTHANTEYDATVRCLIEGDASVSEIAYLAAGDPAALLGLIPSPEGESGSSDIPPGMVRYFYFPYDQCFEFVGQLFLSGGLEAVNPAGGWEAVNKAYDDMPTSTEQILHLEKYMAHETPAALSLADLSAQLGQGWQQLEDAVLGEFDVYNYLLSSLEGQSGWDDVAKEAAAGWGGGRMATYAQDDPTRVVLHLSLQWDDPDELSQFVDAFLQVAGTTAGAWWPADGGITTVRWDSESEHGFATWQGGSFAALLSSSEDDLRAATTAAGYNLDAATSPSLLALP